MSLTTRKRLREMLASGKTAWSAGAFDAVSAKLIEEAGFDVMLSSGFAISASHLGEPDVELYTMTENLAVVRNMVRATSIPLIADVDTGYGNAINVMRTVREFEQAGVAAVIIEDQAVPKRCPAIADVLELVTVEEGEAKIRAAVAARTDPDLVIVARTDAGTEEETIARAKRYAAAGADMIQPISRGFTDFDSLKRLRDAAGVPLSLQIMRWLETDLTPDQIEEVAGIAHYPLVALLTATDAMRRNLAAVRAARSTRINLPVGQTPLGDFKTFIGFDRVMELQAQFLTGTEPR
ncbi:oxaloacetate decarboxylase [Tistrella mobilis]|uniref:isocitrate lyase/PEP mutase family protein n=1 Tax=Tistrella mobilis TaxID=171437 RepID=UPI003558209B